LVWNSQFVIKSFLLLFNKRNSNIQFWMLNSSTLTMKTETLLICSILLDMVVINQSFVIEFEREKLSKLFSYKNTLRHYWNFTILENLLRDKYDQVFSKIILKELVMIKVNGKHWSKLPTKKVLVSNVPNINAKTEEKFMNLKLALNKPKAEPKTNHVGMTNFGQVRKSSRSERFGTSRHILRQYHSNH